MQRCSRAAPTRAATPATLTVQASRRPSAVSARVDLGVGGRVDHHPVRGEVEAGHRLRAAEVELVPADRLRLRPRRPPGTGRAGRSRRRPAPASAGIGTTSASRGWAMSAADRSACVQRDRPVDGQRLVGQVDEGVGVLGRRAPVVVDQVGVGRLVVQGLEGVAHAAGHEHRGLRSDLHGEGAAEVLPRPQVDPGTEDPSGGDRDQLVPRLGVDAPGDPAAGVERHVLLDRTEVGQARARPSCGVASSP